VLRASCSDSGSSIPPFLLAGEGLESRGAEGAKRPKSHGLRAKGLRRADWQRVWALGLFFRVQQL